MRPSIVLSIALALLVTASFTEVGGMPGVSFARVSSNNWRIPVRQYPEVLSNNGRNLGRQFPEELSNAGKNLRRQQRGKSRFDSSEARETGRDIGCEIAGLALSAGDGPCQKVYYECDGYRSIMQVCSGAGEYFDSGKGACNFSPECLSD